MAEMYYYNGVLLPKIPETKKFWDDREYPRIVIRAWGNGHHYTYYGQSAFFYYYSNQETISISPYCYSSWLDNVENAAWTYPSMVRGSGFDVPISEIIWANFDITDDSGNIVFAASTPVSTESVRIHRNVMIQGWLIGKRLAAMRGQPWQVADTARLGLATLGKMILGKE